MFMLFLFAGMTNLRKMLSIKKKKKQDFSFIILISIIFYLLFCLLHLIVHIEPRYLVGTNFLFILSIILNFEKDISVLYDKINNFTKKVL